jgi:hypothetical protein
MVIFGSGAESRPAWTRIVAVVYGSEGGELGFPSVAHCEHDETTCEKSMPTEAAATGVFL